MFSKPSHIFVVLITVSLFTATAPKNIPLEKKIIKKAYSGLSGFGIDKTESEMIFQAGGDPTYGEITYNALNTLFQELKPTQKDVYYDLGCGIGKTCIQTLLTTPIKKAVGVELSHSRVIQAKQAANNLRDIPILKKKTLQFREENIVTAEIGDATIIFMCSLCFSDELMKQLTDKLATLKPGLRVVSLRKLTDNSQFILEKELDLPMTWSKSSAVYVYRLASRKNYRKRNRKNHAIA